MLGSPTLIWVKSAYPPPGQAPPHWASPALRDLPLSRSVQCPPLHYASEFRSVPDCVLHYATPYASFRSRHSPSARCSPARTGCTAFRSRYQLPGDSLPVGERWRYQISRSGTGLRATRSALTLVRCAILRLGCSRPFALSLPLGGRPLIPAALTLRSRYQLPGGSLASWGTLAKPNNPYRAKAKIISLIQNVNRPFQTGSTARVLSIAHSLVQIYIRTILRRAASGPLHYVPAHPRMGLM